MTALFECLNEYLFNCCMLLPQAPTVVKCQKLCSNLGMKFLQAQGFVWFWTPCILCPHVDTLFYASHRLVYLLMLVMMDVSSYALKLKSRQKSFLKSMTHALTSYNYSRTFL